MKSIKVFRENFDKDQTELCTAFPDMTPNTPINSVAELLSRKYLHYAGECVDRSKTEELGGQPKAATSMKGEKNTPNINLGHRDITNVVQQDNDRLIRRSTIKTVNVFTPTVLDFAKLLERTIASSKRVHISRMFVERAWRLFSVS